MNRVGMMVDLSHLSRTAAMQAIALSKGAGDRVAFRHARAWSTTTAIWTRSSCWR
jgi:microsomal dipeptidase-like Zn-dependent dipeptidase